MPVSPEASTFDPGVRKGSNPCEGLPVRCERVAVADGLEAHRTLPLVNSHLPHPLAAPHQAARRAPHVQGQEQTGCAVSLGREPVVPVARRGPTGCSGSAACDFRSRASSTTLRR
jgi:hypothetical protein